jgi:hypothetical protein
MADDLLCASGAAANPSTDYELHRSPLDLLLLQTAEFRASKRTGVGAGLGSGPQGTELQG